MKILITNDDGIKSPGIQALFEGLRPLAECLVVAPHEECSATGHSISLYKNIAVERVHLGGGVGYAIEGTPADCVKFAVAELAKGKIDLIISGINLGLNSGISVYYSGTVSAAREGVINGIPSIAVSQGRAQLHDFSYGVELIRSLVQGFQKKILPPDTFLNINIPPLAPAQIKGVRIVKQAHSRFAEWFEAHPDNENGKKSYVIKGDIRLLSPDGKSDEEVLQEGYVSVTPLQIDLTHYERMADLDVWLRDYWKESNG